MPSCIFGIVRRFLALLVLSACGKAAVPSAPPSELYVGPRASSSPARASTPIVDPIVTLATTPGTSLAGVWLRRLAAAWQATHDAKSPEVTVAADALRANARWLSIDDEITLLARLVPLAPVF